MNGQPPPPSYPPPPVQEPSITMDLMDAIRNPQSDPTTAYPIGMGMRMPGLGMRPPTRYGTRQFQFEGSMGGFPSGPKPPSHPVSGYFQFTSRPPARQQLHQEKL